MRCCRVAIAQARAFFFPGSHGQIVGVNAGPVLIGEEVLAGRCRVLGGTTVRAGCRCPC